MRMHSVCRRALCRSEAVAKQEGGGLGLEPGRWGPGRQCALAAWRQEAELVGWLAFTGCQWRSKGTEACLWDQRGHCHWKSRVHRESPAAPDCGDTGLWSVEWRGRVLVPALPQRLSLGGTLGWLHCALWAASNGSWGAKKFDWLHFPFSFQIIVKKKN